MKKFAYTLVTSSPSFGVATTTLVAAPTEILSVVMEYEKALVEKYSAIPGYALEILRLEKGALVKEA